MNRRTAIVTGGSRGIGRAAVEKLSRSGYNVVFSYLCSKDEAERLAGTVRCGGNEALCFRADCGSSSAADALVEFCVKNYGRIDLLVNNAGIALRKLLTDTTDGDIHELLESDLAGAIYMSRAVIPHMLRQKLGAIVNVSSVYGVSGASMETVYSAAKAGLIGFTKALAKELAPSSVTVNCVAPGIVDTDMNSFLTDAERGDLADGIPLSRFGTAGEVADCILFLAEHRYITGRTLVVDGGLIL